MRVVVVVVDYFEVTTSKVDQTKGQGQLFSLNIPAGDPDGRGDDAPDFLVRIGGASEHGPGDVGQGGGAAGDLKLCKESRTELM